jgi:hypothetical protein
MVPTVKTIRKKTPMAKFKTKHLPPRGDKRLAALRNANIGRTVKRQRRTASGGGLARCKLAKCSRDNKTKQLRELRATLLDAFLQSRDRGFCSEDARAALDAMADSVDDIPRDVLQVYLALAETSANLAGLHRALSTAENEVMMSVRNGSYVPPDAHCYLLTLLWFTLDDLALWNSALSNPDQDRCEVLAFCTTLIKMCDEIERTDRIGATGETLH